MSWILKHWYSGKEVSKEETGEVRERGRVVGVCLCVCLYVCLKQHESPRYSPCERFNSGHLDSHNWFGFIVLA